MLERGQAEKRDASLTVLNRIIEFLTALALCLELFWVIAYLSNLPRMYHLGKKSSQTDEAANKEPIFFHNGQKVFEAQYTSKCP